jgi:uncharacterized coiled-coil DUF342 family protein
MDDIINNALNALHTNNQLMATRAELANAQESYHLLNERVSKVVAEQQKIIEDMDKLVVKLAELRLIGRQMRDAIRFNTIDNSGAQLIADWEKADNAADDAS